MLRSLTVRVESGIDESERKNYLIICRSVRVVRLWVKLDLTMDPALPINATDLCHTLMPCDVPYYPKGRVMWISRVMMLRDIVNACWSCLGYASASCPKVGGRRTDREHQAHSTKNPISSSTTPARPFVCRCVPELTGGHVFCRSRSFSASRSA